MNRPVHSASLEAMSTTVTVIGTGIAEEAHRSAMEQIWREVNTWEERFSRFRPDSMLSRVNAADCEWTPVDREFMELLATAREAVFATEGRFNPAVLDALRAQGYDRTIEEVRTATLATVLPTPPVAGRDAWAEVQIDARALHVRLPAGMRIDFGGIAKGALADRLADRYIHWPGGAISIGGDMCVWGEPPDGDAWRAGIEHPLDPDRDITAVALAAGERWAIATSSRTKRSWRAGQGNAHHLIDPFTGTPTTNDVLAVSVCAPTVSIAEVVTKNLMVAATHGPLHPGLLLDAHWALVVPNTLDLVRITKEAA